MSNSGYDEDEALWEYISRNYERQMTGLERRIAFGFDQGLSRRFPPGSPEARKADLLWGPATDVQIEAALSDGLTAFRGRVCARVLSEASGLVQVNRCPVCGRITRTPRARQCRWCLHNWHPGLPEGEQVATAL